MSKNGETPQEDRRERDEREPIGDPPTDREIGDPTDDEEKQRVGGEGSYSAARRHRKGAEAHARQAGKVDEAAAEARRSVGGDEAEDLARAEAEGKARARGEDPELYRKAGGKR